MKTFTVLALFNMMLFSSVLAQTSDEEDVAVNVETLRKAMLDADKSAMEKLTDKELSYGHSAGKIETQADFIEVITSGKNNYREINLSEQKITITDKIAIVRHTFVAVVVNNGELQKPNLGVMQVWRKQKNAWQLLARQAFKL